MKTKLMENYNKWYEVFYGNDSVGTELYEEEQQAIAKFDDWYANNEVFRTFVVTMAQVTGDGFTSDREIAAFMLAYLETSKVITERYKAMA